MCRYLRLHRIALYAIRRHPHGFNLRLDIVRYLCICQGAVFSYLTPSHCTRKVFAHTAMIAESARLYKSVVTPVNEAKMIVAVVKESL